MPKFRTNSHGPKEVRLPLRYITFLLPGAITDVGKFKKEYGSKTLFRSMCLVANWVVRDEHAQIHGLKVLVDWSGVTPQHGAAIFSPENAKKFVNFYQVCVPL